MKAIASIFIWALAALMTLAVFFAMLVIMLFVAPFDKKRKIAHAQGFWWADVLIRVNPFWHFEISGLEHINPRRTYVIVANHRSIVDIVILYKTRMQFKWVAKEILFKIPVFGWCMSRTKHIRLSRESYSSIRDVYSDAARWLKEGVSVFFFPEGTRSTTGRMNAFKNGAFKLAIQEKKPILPIYIGGSSEIIPRGSWVFEPGVSCKLTILPEVDTASFGPHQADLLRDQVYQILANQEEKERGKL